jgi:hypothetical protein
MMSYKKTFNRRYVNFVMDNPMERNDCKVGDAKWTFLKKLKNLHVRMKIKPRKHKNFVTFPTQLRSTARMKVLNFTPVNDTINLCYPKRSMNKSLFYKYLVPIIQTFKPQIKCPIQPNTTITYPEHDLNGFNESTLFIPKQFRTRHIETIELISTFFTIINGSVVELTTVSYDYHFRIKN